jgi:hypothetical protein
LLGTRTKWSPISGLLDGPIHRVRLAKDSFLQEASPDLDRRAQRYLSLGPYGQVNPPGASARELSRVAVGSEGDAPAYFWQIFAQWRKKPPATSSTDTRGTSAPTGTMPSGTDAPQGRWDGLAFLVRLRGGFTTGPARRQGSPGSFGSSRPPLPPGQCPCTPRLRPPVPRSVSHAHSPGARGGCRLRALRPSDGPSLNALLGVLSPVTVVLLSVVLGATSSPGLAVPAASRSIGRSWPGAGVNPSWDGNDGN